jgi:glycosyltransferase involved in cell wall biosynthesis
MLKISILIPVFNEENTIQQILDKVLQINFGTHECEIIVINDGSTDSTFLKLDHFKNRVINLQHPNNLGKGAALRTGFLKSSGEIIIIQDADLEYCPEDLLKLLGPFELEQSDIVIGVRSLQKISIIYRLSPYYFGGRMINILFNLFSPVKIKDIHSGYKLARREMWQSLDLRENGFNFCHEFLSKAVLRKACIKEVVINYDPRSKLEGKKIRALDGIIAINTILKIFLGFKIKKLMQDLQQNNI